MRAVMRLIVMSAWVGARTSAHDGVRPSGLMSWCQDIYRCQAIWTYVLVLGHLHYDGARSSGLEWPYDAVTYGLIISTFQMCLWIWLLLWLTLLYNYCCGLDCTHIVVQYLALSGAHRRLLPVYTYICHWVDWLSPTTTLTIAEHGIFF